jgi:hypothetical protein
MYEGRTPELAAKVLLDTALMREVASTKDEEQQLQLIDNAIVQAAAERERELAEAKEREAAERHARRAAEGRAQELAERLEVERVRRQDEQRRAYEEREQLARTQATHSASEIERLKQEHGRSLEELQGTVEKQSEQLSAVQHALERGRRRRRLELSAVITAVAVSGAAVPIALHEVTGAWPVTLLILAALAVSGLALIPHVGRRRVWGAIGVVGLVLGIVVAVHEIVADSGKTKPNPVPAKTTTKP